MYCRGGYGVRHLRQILRDEQIMKTKVANIDGACEKGLFILVD